jgi:hypothetical protein
MDVIAWYIATLHSLIGHAKTAVVLGQPEGNTDDCVICQYEREPTEENKRRVEDAMREPDVPGDDVPRELPDGVGDLGARRQRRAMGGSEKRGR